MGMNFLFTLMSICLLWQPYSAQDPTLKVEISSIRKAQGKLWIAIYRPGEKFGGDNPGMHKIVPVNSMKNKILEFNLPEGTYAIAIFHDVNNNEELDKNLVGIPKEPYGFSNNFKPRFSAPQFKDCSFELPAQGKQISIELNN